MPALEQLSTELRVASGHHKQGNYAVSIPLCRSLLQQNLSSMMAVECHVMLITAHVPDALEHGVAANIIAREILADCPDDERSQELYDITQHLLRILQERNREEREEALLDQQYADLARASANQPPSEPPANQYGGTFLPFSSPTRRHRRRLSNYDSSLPEISEAHEEEPAVRADEGRKVYRNRRPSSLSRAAENLARNIGSSRADQK